MRRTWDDASLTAAIAASKNYTDACLTLGLSPKGGNFGTLRRSIKRLGLSTAHFESMTDVLKRMWTTSARNRIAEPDVFFVRTRRSQGGLVRMAKRHLLPNNTCWECGHPNTWNGKPLTLQLDHIDGDRDNNTRENLRWICPNCHTQTPTFSGRKCERGEIG